MPPQILRFTGNWRPYQAAVLSKFEDYLDDSKLHLIAAPGSGKTVLGIELFSRLAKPTVVVVPRISIQRQWVAAIEKLFKASSADEVTISQTVDKPAMIMVITYQALKSLQQKWSGQSLTELGAPDRFVLVLDECHHMLGSWADTTSELISAGYIDKVVALTATPPLDAVPSAWAKYQHVCGAADFEISAAELVSHKSLCPHQDFVYVSQPSTVENNVIQDIQKRRDALENNLLTAPEMATIIAGSLVLFESLGSPFQIGHIDALNALRHVAAKMGALESHREAHSWLGGDVVSDGYDLQKLEAYLDFVFEPQVIAAHDTNAANTVKSWCREAGFWEDNRPCLITPGAVRGLLDNSGSKIVSICNIAKNEFATLGGALRLLVLVDFIGTMDGDIGGYGHDRIPSDIPQRRLTAIGAFAALLTHFDAVGAQVALVTGEVCIVPHWLARQCGINTTKTAPEWIGDSHCSISGSKAHIDRLVAACTDEMRAGGLKILVGTASLLGEGWDCDAINVLVLASQIGSFVTSNQMRGRAIRIHPNQPDKVANIWHLLTCSGDAALDKADFDKLARRFDGFVAPHHNGREICSGVQRIGLTVDEMGDLSTRNMTTLAAADNRQATAVAWQTALAEAKNGSLAQQFSLQHRTIPFRLTTAFLFKAKGAFSRLLNPLAAFYHSGTIDMNTLITQRLAKMVIISLGEAGLLRDPARLFKVKFSEATSFTVSGGNLKDQAIISESISQLLSCTASTRYALAVKLPLCRPIYLFVPKRLGTNKDLVKLLQRNLARVTGPTQANFLGDSGKELHLQLMQADDNDRVNGLVMRRLWS
jgi:superfamily II DNA or RNA helicase